MDESRALAQHSDDELFALAQDQRSREALEELFSRYHARVHAWCARLLGDPEAADDAVQDIFLRVLVRPLAYEGRGTFGAWLYVVTRNTCLNLLRARRRKENQQPDLLEEALVADSDPEADAEDAHLEALVRAACEEVLSDMEARVIYLRHAWGLRVKEINAHLNLDNASGARTYLTTARRKLRAELARRLSPEELAQLLEGDET